ncbi:unnamed protein product [Scytosiphon promiscuus]
MAMDAQLVFLDPKTISDSQIEGVTHVVSKAFLDFNASIGAAKEMVDEEFGDPETSPSLVKGICKGYEGFAALGDDGDGGSKIVGVSFVDLHAEGSRVATLGPVSSLAPGAGRKTFKAACEYAEKLGFSTLVLMQVAANSRSFSLYAKLGFKAKHTCQYIAGFLSEETPPPSPPASADGSGSGSGPLALTAMVAADVEECADLFLAAHGRDCGWDRTANIAGSLSLGHPFPMLVARDADGKVVGYSTGFYIMGHTVATSEEAFIAIFRESSRLHQQGGLLCARFHCPVEYTGLLSWALAQKGLKILRATVIMTKGPYEHTPWSDDAEHVVAPSISGY